MGIHSAAMEVATAVASDTNSHHHKIVGELQVAKNRLTRENGVLKSANDELLEEIEKVTEEMKAVTEKHAILTRQVDADRRRMERSWVVKQQALREELEGQLSECKEELALVRKKTAGQDTNITEKTAEIARLRDELDIAKISTT